MAIYRQGQASMDAQGYVTGYGTKWREQLTLIRPGATIFFLSQPLQAAVITEVISDTSIRAITTGGAVVQKTNYLILLHDSLTVDGLAQDVAETLRYYQGKESEFAGFIEIIKDFDWDKLQKIQEDVKTNADAAAASQQAAKTSENNAKTSATNAANSKKGADTAKAAAESARDAANTAKTGAETAREGAETARDAANTAKAGAESARDQAEEYAKQAAEPYKDLLQPLPDVWIPFNDSLDMITGFAPGYKKITVGDDVITMPSDKVVNFKRASGATYINKAGVLTIADVDEPRFERDGLLIEGQRTNYFINSNSPELWNPNPGLEISKTKTDPLGFKYATFKPGEFSGGTGAYTVIAGLTPNKIPVVKNDMVTISFRAKGNNVRFGARFDKGDPLSAVAIAYIDCDSLGIHLSGGDIENIVAKNAVRVGEWVFVEVVYKITDETTHVRGVITIANKTGGGILDETSFMDLTTPQIEVGSCASSFIITEGSPTTRASDIVLIPIPMNWATPPICALMEVNVNWGAVNKMPNIEGSARLLNVSITGSTTEIQDESYMYFGLTSGGRRLIITNGKGSKTEYKAYGDRVKNKFVAGFIFTEEKKLQVVVDGVLGSESPSLWTKQRYIAGNINIGGQSASGNRHLFGHVKNLRIWHKALTDHQLGEIV
ncbi:tail fiber [Escherichia phage vB_EcoS-G3B1]|nr:tail fiber [Escherichia phage vB_EcoS-G3B1]